MKKENQENWEKEFDEKVQAGEFSDEDWIEYEEGEIKAEYPKWENIKRFIRRLIQQAREKKRGATKRNRKSITKIKKG